MADVPRPISLKSFVDNLPFGAVNDPSMGRMVFGDRLRDTLPYLVKPGAKAELKEGDEAKLPVHIRAFARTFDLADPSHRTSYEGILNATAAGWYKVLFVQRHWNEEKSDMKIYIEFVERHRVIHPQDAYDAMISEMTAQGRRPVL